MLSIYGTIIHSKNAQELEILENTLLTVREGKVLSIEQKSLHEISKDTIVLKKGSFLIPGFVDTHIHAPQFLNNGSGIDLPLLEWLEKYTFPVEASFSDSQFAENVYGKVVDRLLKNGTTTSCFYGTIHLEACKRLFNVMVKKGLRGFVGKVCMDRNSPEFYVESTKDSIASTIEFIKYCLESKSTLVAPIVTPRFVPSCTPTLMRELSNISKSFNVPIQSHLCENLSENEWVKELHPNASSYAGVYNEFGLLGEKTVMAHCIHMSDEEVDLLKDTKTGISHCANSNFNLCSGICKVKKLMKKGLKIGLGTDCSGGYSPSMLDSIKSAIIASKVLKFNGQEESFLSLPEAFYLATRGGAAVLGLPVGSFDINSMFDAVVVDLNASDSPIDFFSSCNPYEMLEKFVMCGDDRNISSVFVNGLQSYNKNE